MNSVILSDNRKKLSLNDAHLMYVATLYTGEDVHALPLMPDIVAVDWQVRLFSFLSDKGYKLSFKPHPESYTLPPEYFHKKQNVKILSGLFSDVWQEADFLLFDYPQTTAFREALHTDRPIVVFDFPRLKISNIARPLLEKRCSLVKAWFDKDGRAQVDWDDLDKAINNAKNLSDNSFVQAFFPE